MKRAAVFTSFICILSLALLVGCATGPKGPTDEELVMQQVQALIDDLFAGNVDNLLSYVSEDFYHYEAGDKASLADHLEQGKQMGYTENVPGWLEEHEAEVNLDQAVVTVDGNKATVYPIEISGDLGSVTVELGYQKDADGVWRIVEADVEGV